MSYFIIQHQVSIDKEIVLQGQEAQHLGYARRTRKGEVVKIQDPQGHRFAAKVAAVRRDEVRLQVLKEVAVPEEPKFKIGLFQALVSEQSLDYILQKATELGVSEIYLFHAQHSPHHFKGERLVKKISRWHRIVSEAAKQCERVKIPQLQFLLTFNEAVSKMGKYKVSVILHPEASLSLTEFLKEHNGLESLGVGIGPEGGFSASEIETIDEIKSIKVVHTGPRILRAETAAVSAIAITQAFCGDL